jgi:hypothetical protein
MTSHKDKGQRKDHSPSGKTPLCQPPVVDECVSLESCSNLSHPHAMSLIGVIDSTLSTTPIILPSRSQSCSLEDVLERVRRQSNAERPTDKGLLCFEHTADVLNDPYLWQQSPLALTNSRLYSEQTGDDFTDP